jgi:hypothetical protein
LCPVSGRCILNPPVCIAILPCAAANQEWRGELCRAAVLKQALCSLPCQCPAEVDGRPSLAALGASRFGDCLLELPLSGGWGVATAFSPSGACLAVTSQGSQLTLLTGIDLADPASLDAAAAASGRLQHLQLPGLPLKCLIFLSDSVLAAGGFDYHPLLFVRRTDGQWQYVRSLQGESGAGGSSSSSSRSGFA